MGIEHEYLSVADAIARSEERSEIVWLEPDSVKLEELQRRAIGFHRTSEYWVAWGVHRGPVGERYWRVHMAVAP